MPIQKPSPLSCIKSTPLPHSTHKGLRLQARSATVYNPTTPTRDDIRKSNYDRRLRQMNERGYKSPNYQPYCGIGDPFYLDQKEIILRGLGQWVPPKTESSSDESQDESESGKASTHVESAKSFVSTKRVILSIQNK